MILYMKVTKDEYELPIVVADSMAELSRMCGVTISCISHALADKKLKNKKTSYIKVEVDNEQ